MDLIHLCMPRGWHYDFHCLKKTTEGTQIEIEGFVQLMHVREHLKTRSLPSQSRVGVLQGEGKTGGVFWWFASGKGFGLLLV